MRLAGRPFADAHTVSTETIDQIDAVGLGVVELRYTLKTSNRATRFMTLAAVADEPAEVYRMIHASELDFARTDWAISQTSGGRRLRLRARRRPDRNHGAIATPAAPSGEPCPPAPPSMAPWLMSDSIGPEMPTPPAPPLPAPPAPPAPPLIVPLLISVPIVPELAIPAPPAPPRIFSSVMGSTSRDNADESMGPRNASRTMPKTSPVINHA
jgi:hypothetical protein